MTVRHRSKPISAELPPLDGSAPLPPVQEASGINIPVVLAATGGALGLCAAAFFFIL